MKKTDVYVARQSLRKQFDRIDYLNDLIVRYRGSSIYLLNQNYGGKVLHIYYNQKRRSLSIIQKYQNRLKLNMKFIKLNCPRVSQDLDWCFKKVK